MFKQWKKIRSSEEDFSYVDCFHLVFWGYTGRGFLTAALFFFGKKKEAVFAVSDGKDSLFL